MEEYAELSIGYSDGKVSTHPRNRTREGANVAADGSWDFFREIAPSEPKDQLWRIKCASAMVEKYAPEKKKQGLEFVLTSMPAGYKLFEHNKGKKNEGIRKDTYLFGHPNGSRFRSPAEFLPHILHLTAHEPQNKGNKAAGEYKVCSCKYCGAAPRTPSGATRNNAPLTEEAFAAARKQASALERLGEQEMVGWVARKGEVVWVWTGEENDLSAVIDIADSELWAAGVVLEKPDSNPPFRPPQSAGGFASSNMGGGAPWAEMKEKETYKIQLCGALGTERPGERLERVQQHFIKPWLSRPDFIKPPEGRNKRREHLSVEGGRKIARTFSLFEFVTIATPPEADNESVQEEEGSKAHVFNGVFLGAEKIFIGDPVRILDPENPTQEDVLVLDNILAVTQFNKDNRKQTAIRLIGSVYYKANSIEDRAKMVKPETFAQLPFRMRRGDPQKGGPLIWCLRNKLGELGEVTMKCVHGRWYEPEAVMYWMYPDEDARLARSEVSRWVRNRAEALGWSYVNDIEVLSDPDLKKPTTSLTNKQMAEMQATPVRTKKSSSAFPPGSKSRMARAVADDKDSSEEMDDDIEEFDEQENELPSSTEKMTIR